MTKAFQQFLFLGILILFLNFQGQAKAQQLDQDQSDQDEPKQNLNQQQKHKKSILIGFEGIDQLDLLQNLSEKTNPIINQFFSDLFFTYTGGVENTYTEQIQYPLTNWRTILTGTYANKHQITDECDQQCQPNTNYQSIFELIRKQNSDSDQQQQQYNNYVFSNYEDLEKIIQHEKKSHHFIESKIDQNQKFNTLIDSAIGAVNSSENPADFIFLLFDMKQQQQDTNNINKQLSQIEDIITRLNKFIQDKIEQMAEDWLVLAVLNPQQKQENQDESSNFLNKISLIASNQRLNIVALQQDVQLDLQREQLHNQYQDQDENNTNANKNIYLQQLQVLLNIQNQDMEKQKEFVYSLIPVSNITPTILEHLQISQDYQNTWQFDGIPLLGENIGLVNLIFSQFDNQFRWQKPELFSQNNIHFFNNNKKQEEKIKIYANGNFIEQISSSQNTWPESEESLKIFENSKNFDFIYNDIAVNYLKAYQPDPSNELSEKKTYKVVSQKGFIAFIIVFIVLTILICLGFIFRKIQQGNNPQSLDFLQSQGNGDIETIKFEQQQSQDKSNNNMSNMQMSELKNTENEEEINKDHQNNIVYSENLESQEGSFSIDDSFNENVFSDRVGSNRDSGIKKGARRRVKKKKK